MCVPNKVDSNRDVDTDKVGERPHEMADRKQEHVPIFDFEDLSGWQVVCHHGAQATFVQTREQQMWGKFVGKLTYEGKDESSWVEIMCPEPIPIPEGSTAVDLWIFSDDNIRRSDVTRANLYLRIEDVQGEFYNVQLSELRRASEHYWFLAHKRLPEIAHPAKFVSLILRNCSNSKSKKLYLDSLCFYKEALDPLDLKYTLEQIKKEAPFPTTPDTILPPCSVSYENSVRREGDSYVFSCKGPNDSLEYCYEPRTGTLSDLTVIHNGVATFQPATDGGPALFAEGKEFDAGDISVNRKLLECNLKDSTLHTRWRYSIGDVQADININFRIKNRTMIVDFASASRDFAGLSLGHSAGTPGAKIVEVPYLTFSQTQGEPYILYWQGLFVSSLLDWYNSDASELYGGSGKVTATTANYNGGSKYIPCTDGLRNPLRERLFITVSPIFSEVLPNIPNPPSPMREVVAPLFRLRLLTVLSSPCTYLDRLRTYKAYGLDKLLVEFIGGPVMARQWPCLEQQTDAEFKRLITDTKNLGYDRVILYTYYLGIHTTYSDFNSDDIALLPDGNWNQRCWQRMYSYKSMRAIEWEEKLSPEIHRKFGTTGGYVDVATCIPPWRREDYDARVSGAGMFASYFYAFGKLLLNERKVYNGPVYSEGVMHWMYAGLVDGNRAEISLEGKESWQVPFLVDFDLLRIHPLETDNGPGPLGICPVQPKGADIRGSNAFGISFRSPASDRILAATIVFGHAGNTEHGIGWYVIDKKDQIVEIDSNLWQTIKTYYMMQQLQQRYCMVSVAKISYNHNGRLLSTSEAIATDAYKESQVYVRYVNGLEIYVNGSWDRSWEVNIGDRDYLLPPTGFVAAMGDDFLAYSAEVEDKRVDYVNSPEYVYADARGTAHAFEKLETDGAAAVKLESDCLVAIPASPDVTKLLLNVHQLLPHFVSSRVVIEAVDIEGSVIHKSKCVLTAGTVTVPIATHAISYRIHA